MMNSYQCFRCEKALTMPLEDCCDYVLSLDTREVQEDGSVVQKSGLVCPSCYDPLRDGVIWGLNREAQAGIPIGEFDIPIMPEVEHRPSIERPNLISRLRKRLGRGG